MFNVLSDRSTSSCQPAHAQVPKCWRRSRVCWMLRAAPTSASPWRSRTSCVRLLRTLTACGLSATKSCSSCSSAHTLCSRRPRAGSIKQQLTQHEHSPGAACCCRAAAGHAVGGLAGRGAQAPAAARHGALPAAAAAGRGGTGAGAGTQRRLAGSGAAPCPRGRRAGRRAAGWRIGGAAWLVGSLRQRRAGHNAAKGSTKPLLAKALCTVVERESQRLCAVSTADEFGGMLLLLLLLLVDADGIS